MARRGRVVVAMSGGVDSSTAGCLLREQGYEVIGLFLRAELTGTDAEDARHVARHLGIQFAVVDCTDEFDWLIDHFCAEYARGRTPNPCVRCNAELKFAKLLEVADELQAEQVATGHYARVEQLGRRWALRRGVDGEKDQSYFLSRLNQEQLARALFPLGELTKAEVRATAEAAGLPVHEKAESQDICFVVRPFDLAQDRPFDRARDRPLDSLGGRGLSPLSLPSGREASPEVTTASCSRNGWGRRSPVP